MSTTEIWRAVPSCPGWEASNHGRVRRPEAKIRMPNGGYKTVYVEATFGSISKRDGRHRQCVNNKTTRVSTMVCEAFHGRRPYAHDCMHLNEDKKDNRSTNLAWGTRKENMRSPKLLAAMRDRMIKNHHSRKITKEDAEKIISMKDVLPTKDIAERYGVSAAHIRAIIRGVFRHANV